MAWTGAHLAVAACLLRHRLRVAAVTREGPGVVSEYVTGRDLASLPTEAGQFFRWRFMTRGRWWQAHQFSRACSPRAPYGAFTATLRRRRRVLLLAGGVGVAPLRALLETLPAGPGGVALDGAHTG